MEKEKEKYKYNCAKCDYNTNYKSSYDKHIKSILHETGKKKTRNDKKENKCNECEEIFSSQQSLKNHILNKHKEKEKKEKKEKSAKKYYCKICDIGNEIEQNHKKHLESKKHQHILKLLNFNTV
jgi:hypothetical protein